MRRFPILAVPACIALCLTLLGVPASAGSPATGTAVPHAAAKISHVFVINLENENYATSWGAKSPASYLKIGRAHV